jgi:hypothetical protein
MQQDSRDVEANEGECPKNDDETQGNVEPTKRLDQRHGGQEGGATSSGLAAEERTIGQEEPPSDKRRKITEALKKWDEMEVMELNAEECEDMNPETYDGRTGEMLDAELVATARAEEFELMRKIELFDEVPVSECWERTSRRLTSTRRDGAGRPMRTGREGLQTEGGGRPQGFVRCDAPIEGKANVARHGGGWQTTTEKRKVDWAEAHVH